MNKIYDLACKAGLITFESLHDSMCVAPSIESVAKAQKFAELIIKECAEIADDGFASSNFGNGITGQQLLKHFGVKECN